MDLLRKMKNTQKKIDKLLNNLQKDPSKIKDILETTYLKTLTPKLKKKYFEIEKIILGFKKELENISPRKLMGQIIKETIESKQDRFLTSEQEIIKKDMFFAIERYEFVIEMLKVLQSTNLNKIRRYLQEYLVSNFYRTYCETSIRLFTDILLLIIDYNLSKTDKNKKYYRKQKKNRKRILSGSITLGDLKQILDEFDNNLKEKLGLSSLLREIFLYERGKGFFLRNNVAHERLSLSEIDVNLFLKEIHKVNLLNQIMIKVFYLDIVGSNFTSKDLEYSKNIFGKKKTPP